MLCCHFQCTHFGVVPVFTDRNVCQCGAVLRLCAPFYFLVGMCAYDKVALTPFFLLPTMKDYLDLLCRRAYVPSWLTCLNCLCMTNSKDVESHRVTHSGHTTVPLYPALLQIACQMRCVRARMYLCAPLLN